MSVIECLNASLSGRYRGQADHGAGGRLLAGMRAVRMLAGEPPHTGGSAQAVIMKIIAEPAKAVEAHRKSVPPNVAAAVMKALEKFPADRFATALALADALGDPHFTTVAVSGDGAGAASRTLAWFRHLLSRGAVGITAAAILMAAESLARPTAAPSLVLALALTGLPELSRSRPTE